MPKMVLTHSVVDVERWLAGKSDRVATIGPYASDVTDHVAEDGTNQIAITAEIHDLPGLHTMLASPPAETLAAMERHGVIPPITIYIEK